MNFCCESIVDMFYMLFVTFLCLEFNEFTCVVFFYLSSLINSYFLFLISCLFVDINMSASAR